MGALSQRSMSPLWNRHVHRRRAECARKLAARNFDQEAARTAVDVNSLKVEDGALHVDRHRALQSERRGAADLIAGVSIGDLWATRRDALHAEGPREVLRRDLTVAVHQDAERSSLFVFE